MSYSIHAVPRAAAAGASPVVSPALLSVLRSGKDAGVKLLDDFALRLIGNVMPTISEAAGTGS